MNYYYNYIYFIILAIFVCPHVTLALDKTTPEKNYIFYLKNHYTLNVRNSDSFLEEYLEYDKGGYDFGMSFGYAPTNKFSNELELRHSTVMPSLNNITDAERNHLINLLEKIIYEKVSLSQARKIFAVRRTALFLNCYYDHKINEQLNIQIGGGLGLVAALGYQGFKANRSAYLGAGSQVLLALRYKVTDRFSFYSGYNYFKSHWRYQTDPIIDEFENEVLYEFKDFEFDSHGISLGMIYKF